MKRVLLAILVLCLVAGTAAVLGADALLGTAAVRGRIAAAVERAIGHGTNLADGAGLSVSGLWLLRPTVQVADLVVHNPPGFAGGALATVHRLSARVALLPLLAGHVDLEAVTADGADITVQRDRDGRFNWEPPVRAPSPGTPGSVPAARTPPRIGTVSITNSHVAWGRRTLEIGRLTAEPSGGPVSGTLTVGGVSVALSGTAGPGAVDVLLAGNGAALAVRRGAAGPLAVHATVAELPALAPFFAPISKAAAPSPLPPLRDVVFDAQVGPDGAVSARATAGTSRFGPDLVLDRLDVAASALDAPVEAHASGHLRALPFAAALTLPSLSALRQPGRVPVHLSAQADGATLSLDGTAADWNGSDPEGVVSARVPDFHRTAALAGVDLPALHDVALDARLASAAGGTVAVRGLRVTAAEGDLGGDLGIRVAPLPTIRGSLVSRRLDLDAMRAPAPTPTSPTPASPAAPGPATPAPPAPAAGVPAAAPGPVPLPFARLREADIDVHADVGEIVWRGVAFRSANFRVLLTGGVLRLDPVEAFVGGGALQAQVGADATATPPTASLALLAPGLDAAAVASVLGYPGTASGSLDLDLQLRAAGTTVPAMLRTLDGHAGIALVNGDVDNALLAAALGPALRAASVPVELSGRSAVRCLALGVDAAGGVLTVRTLALDSNRLRLEGEGTIDLSGDTLDLHLRPVVRLGGAAVAVPVHLSGPIRAPVPALERGAVSPGRVGISILLGGGAAAADPCPGALRAARGNRPGPQPQ